MANLWNPNSPAVLGNEWYPTIGSSAPVAQSQPSFVQALRSRSAETIAALELGIASNPAVTDGTGGLSLAGTEVELSGASGDEAAPTALANPASGESVVFWIKGLSFTTSTDYVASTTGGTWRGDEIWVQRYR